MMMITTGRKSVILMAILLGSHSLVFACRGAAPPNTPQEAMKSAEVVFLGKAVDYQLDYVKFVVEKVWKGSISTEITLPVVRSCPIFFDVGQKYIVYFHSKFGHFLTGYNRGVRLDLAAEDLAFLSGYTLEAQQSHKTNKLIIVSSLLAVATSLVFLALFVHYRRRGYKDV